MILHIENTKESQMANVVMNLPTKHVGGNRRNNNEKSYQVVIEFTA